MTTLTPKDYTSTIMRMAGNIAAGFVSTRITDPKFVAVQSVQIARAIVEEVINGKS